ncbi:MAG: hypothetical protein H0X02_07610 [Nitrosomonas sp.]|nr:hypothetical protein [Nitrosomonas sp.]
MKTFNPIIATVIFASFFMAAQQTKAEDDKLVRRSIAENWSAVGLLTTVVQGQEAKVEFISVDDFGTHDECEIFLKSQSESTDYIGKGGTNQNVPPVQWNFDGLCIKKRTYGYKLPSIPYDR